jgi:hypothetical protein
MGSPATDRSVRGVRRTASEGTLNNGTKGFSSKMAGSTRPRTLSTKIVTRRAGQHGPAPSFRDPSAEEALPLRRVTPPRDHVSQPFVHGGLAARICNRPQSTFGSQCMTPTEDERMLSESGIRSRSRFLHRGRGCRVAFQPDVDADGSPSFTRLLSDSRRLARNQMVRVLHVEAVV